MENNLNLKQITGGISVLSAVFGLSLLFIGSKVTFSLFAVIWLLILLCLFIAVYRQREQLFRTIMYILIASTFLNQSILSVHVGFFTLFLYRLILVGCIAIFIIDLLKQRSLADKWERIEVKGVLFFLLFWLTYGFISLLWAKSITDGIKYLFLLGIGIAFVFLSVFAFTKIKHLLLFYYIWLGMTVVLLCLGLINHFAHVQLPSSTLYGGSAYKLGYPTAVFTNQNDFATFLTISFFFYLAVVKNSKSISMKIASIILAVLSIYIIYLTESRASLLAIMIGLVAYVWLLLPSTWKKITGIAGAALVLIGMIAISSPLLHKVHDMYMLAGQYSSTERLPSNLIRFNLLLSTFHYIAQSYGFGVGAGNIPYYLEHESIYNTNQIYEVHNWLAEIMGNFGIFMVFGYITMYAYLFFSIYRMYQEKRNRIHNMLLEGCMVAMIAFIVSSISPSSVSNLYFHWVFLGFVTVTVSVLRNIENSVQENQLLFYRRKEFWKQLL
ncbi:teichuronic acid biosynthesis protein TuaE [Heyndrickxia ginsengihumi]|uniref:teichuronic acid biosynthesis protein TuaE n=1 Tax=Heyndrickxia ginsengihumi TaxID=363870 RepID=UPI003D238621